LVIIPFNFIFRNDYIFASLFVYQYLIYYFVMLFEDFVMLFYIIFEISQSCINSFSDTI